MSSESFTTIMKGIRDALQAISAVAGPTGAAGVGVNNPTYAHVVSNGDLIVQTNIASVTRTGTGKYEIVFVTPFSDANYNAVITVPGNGDQEPAVYQLWNKLAGSAEVRAYDIAGDTAWFLVDADFYFSAFEY